MKNEIFKVAMKVAMGTFGANCIGYDPNVNRWVHSMNYMITHPECQSEFLTEKEEEQMMHDVAKVFMQQLNTQYNTNIKR